MNPKSISHEDLISIYEELKTATQDKRKNLLSKIVESHMYLISIEIARQRQCSNSAVDDMYQEGSIGLMRAAEKFDPSCGFKFATYARWWILQALLRFTELHERQIRLPSHVHKAVISAKRLGHSLGSTAAEASKQLNISEDIAHAVMVAARGIQSLHATGSASPNDESRCMMIDRLESPNVRQDTLSAENDIIEHFIDTLTNFSPLEDAILRLRFGIEQ